MTENTFHTIRDGFTLTRLAASTNGKALHPDQLAIYAEVVPKGTEFVVSDDLIAATADRYGESPYGDLSDQTQTQKWGAIFIQPGSVGEALAAQLVAEAEASAEAERFRLKREYAKYGKQVPLNEAEILRAADAIRSRTGGARR